MGCVCVCVCVCECERERERERERDMCAALADQTREVVVWSHDVKGINGAGIRPKG